MKTIICFLLMFTYLVGLSQERVNRENLKFERSSLVLDNVDGWSYNSEVGEWINKKNSIYVENDRGSGYEILDHTEQTFKTIQTKSFKYKDTLYYIFIVCIQNSGYEYPKLKLGYSVWYEYVGYICTKNEYEKIYNIKDLCEIHFIRMVGTGFNNCYDEKMFLDKIQWDFMSDDEMKMIMPIMKSKEGTIRFYLPELDFKSRELTHEPLFYNFNKGYFETDIQNFNKIIIK